MNENYLWDRSGEAEPDIQQLEETLGTLRYQPQPLQIPASIRPERRRSYFPGLAIAATIALLAIALGLWFSFNRRQAGQPTVAKQGTQNDQKPDVEPKQLPVEPTNQPGNDELAQNWPPPPTSHRHRESARNLATRKPDRDGNTTARAELTPAEQAEKERLLAALHLVSVKLNIAQRRTQGVPALNTTRNQHRIG